MKNKYEKIISIKEIGEEDTVDIKVNGNNLFFANGILTHNSGYGKESVELENIADSMGIAHTADLIISLVQTEELKNNSQMKFEIIKSRISESGVKGLMNIDYDKLKVVNKKEIEDKETVKIISKGVEDIKKKQKKKTNGIT